MADVDTAITFKAGWTLLWTLHDDRSASAQAKADEMGELVDAHELGTWGIAPIGIGTSRYFDLMLADDVTAIVVMLIFGELPHAAY